MRSLLTTNFLGVAETGKDVFSIEFEGRQQIQHFNEDELRSIAYAILSGEYKSIPLREGNALIVSAQLCEDKVTFSTSNIFGSPTATFNITSFLNLLDPDMVRSLAIGIMERKTFRPAPPKPGKMLYKR